MKVIYLFTSPSHKGSSVQTKVLNQIKYLNVAGAECRGAFFSTEVKEVTPLNEQVDLIPVEKCTWKYFRASGQKRNIILAVLGYTKARFHKTDLFYFRFPGAGSLLAGFVKEFGNKTVFEHLSIEELELKLQAKENAFGIRPSKLLGYIEYNLLPVYREKIWGSFIRRNAKAAICNSQEIADWQKVKAKNKYQTTVGGDAVDVHSFSLLKRPAFEKQLNLFFLKGASTNAEFNGLERLFIALKNYQGDLEINFHILGHQLSWEKQYVKENNIPNVYLHKPKYDTELHEFLKDMHIGVATLGLYKKGLNQTTTIKVREYMALGIPFIYGYSDPDLNEDACEFSLQVPNNNTVVDIQSVIKFAQKVLNARENPQKMRKYAEEHLDYSVKMKKVYSYLKTL